MTREASDWVRRERSSPCPDCSAVLGQPCHGTRIHPARLRLTLFGATP